jgi:hypothetical protein
MLGFPLGILSAAGAAVVDTAAYELISSTILGGTAASVTFSNLGDYSSTYKHLQIRTLARVSGATTETLLIRLNSDTGSNYSWHGLSGNGTSVSSFALTSNSYMGIGIHPGTNSSANIFGPTVIDFLDTYSTTKNKTARSLGGMNGALTTVRLHSGLWQSTSSLTSIQVFSEATNFVAGSRFSIYGLRG